MTMLVLAAALQLSCAAKLDSLFADRSVQGIEFGVVVMDTSGTVLYQHEPDARLVPASNMKVLTHVYAFSVLGRDWRPVTRIWKEGNDVVVDAVGDPNLTADQLRAAVSKLGVSTPFRVKVHTLFKGGYPDGWKPDDYQFKYGRPIFAFSVDQAMLPVYALKGGVEPVPSSLGLLIKRGSAKGKADVSYNFWARVATVNGALPESRSKIGELTAPDPVAHAAFMMGGDYAGSADVPARPADVEILGKTLAEMADQCLKPSDNMLAESILQMAAAEDAKRNGRSWYDQNSLSSFTWAGMNLQDWYWSQLGVPRESIRVFDGSGLSRRDSVTPRALASALRYAWSQPFRSDFLNALPRAGVSGTLKSRMKGLPVAAKTGSLNNVAALSGYVFPDSPNPLIFAVIGNTNGRPASIVRSLADKLVSELAAERHGDGTTGTTRDLPKTLPVTGSGSAVGHRVP